MDFYLINNAFPAQVMVGAGALARLEWDREAGKVLIITDRGLLHTENIAKITRLFPKADIYGELSGEPTSAMVDAALEFSRRSRYDLVIGLGGGSALDTAKVVAALHGSRETVAEVFGKDLLGPRRTRMGLIPTTAGTGSEATPNSIVKDSADGVKKAVISKELIPDWVVLDAELTLSLPAAITASTGMDALCHCVESALSVHANPFSLAYSYHGIKLLSENIEAAVADGADLEVRGAMLLGSFLGGLALTIAGTTAVHALSYPLGKRGVPHGVANGMLLPWILEYNLPACAERLMALAPYLQSVKPLESAADIVDLTFEYVHTLPVPQTLDEVGIEAECLPELAAEAMKQERLLANNPRPLTAVDALALYRKLLAKKSTDG
ncbi:alcohol dehydrogenase class IV [Hydrogenispora ethanolica]|jgi:alcohol dehydrogenase class IV|uniref:Alcohol dehydrogenase class IV n=1 Tax=Hydrogenispora ethanolica TaxID=1082276 RepID=A0A4R1RU95_HYDET|nr:iron-containing alcohol dehydrogenase [Hydrogenispora ethanolica]TCL70036.1 alcohol dehydrogenase class IV [Hydrogenispora ethanolica]